MRIILKDSKIKCFILGALFIIFFQVFESLSDVCFSWLEVFKIKPMLKTLRGNKIIADIQTDTEKVDDSVAIGFTYTPPDDDFEDFEE